MKSASITSIFVFSVPDDTNCTKYSEIVKIKKIISESISYYPITVDGKMWYRKDPLNWFNKKICL